MGERKLEHLQNLTVMKFSLKRQRQTQFPPFFSINWIPPCYSYIRQDTFHQEHLAILFADWAGWVHNNLLKASSIIDDEVAHLRKVFRTIWDTVARQHKLKIR